MPAPGEKKAISETPLPFEALKFPGGKIILICPDVKEALQLTPKAVVLTVEEYQRLLEQIEQLKRQNKSDKPINPSICRVTGRIVEDMAEGLSDYLDSKGMKSVNELIGKAVPTLQKWETLDLNYKRMAKIDYDKCIGCNLCYIACEDGAHQAIALVSPNGHGLGPGRVPGKPVPEIKEHECVGCNLCALVCPVDDCITMVSVDTKRAKMSWSDYQAKLGRGEMKPIPAHP